MYMHEKCYTGIMNIADFNALFPPIIIVIALWSLFWKIFALWHAAKNGARVWFVVMMIVNTAGILEIIYLLGIAKIKPDQVLRLK